jgi:hypothetical protein
MSKIRDRDRDLVEQHVETFPRDTVHACPQPQGRNRSGGPGAALATEAPHARTLGPGFRLTAASVRKSWATARLDLDSVALLRWWLV